jgi:hypothetical protein
MAKNRIFVVSHHVQSGIETRPVGIMTFFSGGKFLGSYAEHCPLSGAVVKGWLTHASLVCVESPDRYS